MTPPAVLAALQRWRAGRLDELCSWLAIPSVSADPARAGDVDRAARWLARWQRAHGARAHLVSTPGGRPVVLGHWTAPPGSPLVIIYGHYDVQPAGRGWRSGPFTPVVRAGRLYARGAGDDKGQLFAHLCALAAWRQAGALPVQVLVLAEGAEEVGSPGFGAVVRRLARRVRPRAVVVSDTERHHDGTPTVTVSQRGRLAARLEVDTGGPSVHPGRLGGAVVDPSLVLAEALLLLRTELIPALGARTSAPVDDLGGAEVVVRSDAALSRAAGGRATTGQALDGRVTRRGALSVTRLVAGARGGALPPRSTAWLDVRLPPGGPGPREALHHAIGLLRRMAPPGVTVGIYGSAGTPGLDSTPDAATRRAADEACRSGYGRSPVYLGSGGTIPAVGLMARAFGVPPLLLGFGSPGGNAHGPNEFIDLAGWAAGAETSAALLAAIVRPAGPEPRLRSRGE